MIDALAGIPFCDVQSAEERVGRLLDSAHPKLAEHLAFGLEETSDPDMVLVGLERFLAAADSRNEEIEILAADRMYARLLCTCFDQSHMLTDILCRAPAYARWLKAEMPLGRVRSRDEMAAELAKWVEGCDVSAAASLMRRFKQREILRIAARDIFAHQSVASITEDLSNLADASLEVALRVAYPGLVRRYGRPMFTDTAGTSREVGFVVIGMGKLGGRELNFSSDIDLLFLYAEDGETEGGESSSVSTAEFFQKLGEQVIRLISEQTGEGFIFRIDMRLRPYGRVSPLAIDVPRALDYYAQFAQAWERQALIKARPVAGDEDLGRQFIEATRPFVFPRYFDDATLTEIRCIKGQTEEQVADRQETGIEVKLGRGGIRDIEFTVQMLQMLNGGRMPDLRTPQTLSAIRALEVRAHLTPFEATALASNYVFLREVEHRLQIEGGQQRHVLPNTEQELDRFARRLGYRSGASFMADYVDRTEENRRILDRFLSTEGAGRLWTYDLLSPHADGRASLERLARYGFKDGEKARRELQRLSMGPEEQPYALHVRQQFAEIAPALIEALSASGDPDATLVRLGRILATVGAPGALYATLRSNPAFCSYLVTLGSNSQFLSEILIRDPGLFDVFGSGDALDTEPTREELEEQLGLFLRAHDSAAAPYRLKEGETLRIGMRELFRDIPVVEVGRELTQVAEVCLAHALREAQAEVEARYGKAHGAFAILGLGKLGGREMGYGSDLDLVFVYEDGAKTRDDVSPMEYFPAVASKTMSRLREPTRYGLLYEIDARLRPDGKKGVLAVNDRRIIEYYREEAQPWERLALMKVRAVAGDREFGERVEALARESAFSLPLTPENLRQIDDIRGKITSGASPFDLKRGEGGLVETEFAVRLLQLRYAADLPELKRGDALGALDVLERAGVVPANDLHMLREAYLLLRRIENRTRMMNGRSESMLPREPADRAELAARLGIPGGDLLDIVAQHQRAVHAIYQNVLQVLG